MNANRLRITFSWLFLLSLCSLSARADDLYVITIATPTNFANVALNTNYVVSGSVDWPFYREDIDQVWITITKNGIFHADQSQALTSSGSSSCTFSTGGYEIAKFSTPGTYQIKVDAISNGFVKNSKTILVYAQ